MIKMATHLQDATAHPMDHVTCACGGERSNHSIKFSDGRVRRSRGNRAGPADGGDCRPMNTRGLWPAASSSFTLLEAKLHANIRL